MIEENYKDNSNRNYKKKKKQKKPVKNCKSMSIKIKHQGEKNNNKSNINNTWNNYQHHNNNLKNYKPEQQQYYKQMKSHRTDTSIQGKNMNRNKTKKIVKQQWQSIKANTRPTIQNNIQEIHY